MRNVRNVYFTRRVHTFIQEMVPVISSGKEKTETGVALSRIHRGSNNVLIQGDNSGTWAREVYD